MFVFAYSPSRVLVLFHSFFIFLLPSVLPHLICFLLSHFLLFSIPTSFFYVPLLQTTPLTAYNFLHLISSLFTRPHSSLRIFSFLYSSDLVTFNTCLSCLPHPTPSSLPSITFSDTKEPRVIEKIEMIDCVHPPQVNPLFSMSSGLAISVLFVSFHSFVLHHHLTNKRTTPW